MNAIGSEAVPQYDHSRGHSATDTPHDWVEFWNRPNAIYANRRNLEAHFSCLLRDLEAYLPEGGAVLDFGCGDALAAEAMAARCGTLYLYDAASVVRERLQARFRDHPRIKVLDEDALSALPTASIDLILAVSVLQYIPRDDLRGLLLRWRGLLKPEGYALIADVVDPHTPMLQDIASQLRMARQHGFLLAALLGLGRLALSDYRRIRHEAGFSTYTPAELLDVLEAAGLHAAPLPRNVGPTPHRRSFLARPTNQETAGQNAEEPALKVQ